tara:strand:+ start:181 stop:393 length:213 start_codon:yes stop_codon:yes gene_type:complete
MAYVIETPCKNDLIQFVDFHETFNHDLVSSCFYPGDSGLIISVSIIYCDIISGGEVFNDIPIKKIQKIHI